MLDFWERKKILITGGAGFLGSYLVDLIKKKGGDIFIPRSNDYDLTNKGACEQVVMGKDIVIHLAARVGGIGFNLNSPAEQFYKNIIMDAQLMEAARLARVGKFVGVGTVCSYPKITPIPFKEEALWNGYPEETNAPFGLAKKMLLVQSQAYRKQYNFNSIYLILTNLYGPRDHFDPSVSHVIPALIKKVFEAKKTGKKFIEVWGTGNASREFLYVEDAAIAIALATEKYNGFEPINIGSGEEISIKGLAKLICSLCDFRGSIIWDKSKPDGQPHRHVDTTRAKERIGFKAKVDLSKGLRETINWYQNSKK